MADCCEVEYSKFQYDGIPYRTGYKLKIHAGDTLCIDLGVRKEGAVCFDGLSISVNLNSSKTAFEIGTNFRTRIEFDLKRLITCSVGRILEKATIMQGSSQEMCSLLSNHKILEDKSPNYSASFA